jgi:RNA polymerase sigma factor (sigma-70 family)
MDIKKRTNFIERTDIMKSYLHDLNKLKVMTPEREKELFEEYNASEDNERKLQIRNEIIEGNQRFIFAIAKRYATNDLLGDLISEANCGAIEAFYAYDIATGYRFTTIADYYIRRSINQFLNKENMMVVPTNNARVSPKIKKIEQAFYNEHHRLPLASEVVAILDEEYGIDVKNSGDIYGASIEYIDDSCSPDDDEYTMEDSSEFAIVSSSHNDYVDVMDKDNLSYILSSAMNELSEREATIIKMYAGIGDYYKEYKDKEIAEILGLSSERVRQLRNGAIEKLKTMIAPAIAY